jgi:hypothetical protein
MAIAIRIPSETHSPLPQYYRHRTTVLSARLYRRIIPLTLIFILLVESYRFFSTSTSTTSPLPPPPPPLSPAPPSPPPAPLPDDDPFSLGPPLPGLKHLVIVACHAIYLGGALLGASEDEWALQSFQRGRKAQDTFLAHISAGVAAASADTSALLVFSGGETRLAAGPRTEGGSYFELAAARGLITDSLTNRTTTEIGALDSYQNLLFSILRFHELTDTYPERVTVVSYEFKRKRFEELHRAAIGWPAERFDFVGIDPEWKEEKEKEEVTKGEYENAVKLWTDDPYACRNDGLRAKRRARNAGRRRWAYESSVDGAVAELLGWCRKEGKNGAMFEGRLPWSK